MEVKEEEKQPEEKVKTPEPQDEVSMLKTKYEIEIERLKQDFINESRAGSTKSQKIRELEEKIDSHETLASINKAALTLLATQRGQTVDEVEGDIRKNQPDLLAQLEGITQQATQKQYQKKADILYREAQSVFADDKDALETVVDALMAGRADRAEARIAKARAESEAKKATPQEPVKQAQPKKSWEEMSAEDKAKLVFEWQKEQGKLVQETGSPTQVGQSDYIAKRDKMLENPNDPNAYREYLEARRQKGIR